MRKILRVGGYARVSHEEQKKFGYSINAQIEEIQKWCDHHQHQLVKIYIDEGFSASNMKRPQLQQMLSDLKNLDAVVFTRLDRFSRNVFEANTMLNILNQNNVAMIAISEDSIDTSTANGKFIFNLKVNLAQHELDKGSERIKAVFDYKVKNGQPITGNMPYGYKILTENGVKRIIKDENTEAIVNEIFSHFLKYHSIHKTCAYFNSKYGLNRTYESYSKLLKSKFYTGSFRGNDNYAPPYIDIETHEKIKRTILSNVRVRKNSNIYLFSGLMRCPKCNCKLNGMGRKYKGKKYHYYRCGNAYGHHQCDLRVNYNEINIETFLLDNIEPLIIQHCSRTHAVKNKSKNNAEKELKELKKEMDNLNYMFMKKRIDTNTYDTLYEELEQKVTRLKKKTSKKESTHLLQDFLNSDWRTIYNDMSRETKRSLWRNIIQELHVSKENEIYDIKVTFL